MSIYDKPTKTLMLEFAKEPLKKGQAFDKRLAVAWFTKHYPKIKPATVEMHVEGMSTNSTLRRHHPSIRAGSGHDLFFKLAPGQFRLWDQEIDPAPRYGDDSGTGAPSEPPSLSKGEREPTDDSDSRSAEFAFERDLRNYLEKNPGVLESGLRIFEDEGLRGIEFAAGGRFIDILAVSDEGDLVVVELKVSVGHDRVVGQILRYIAWVRENMAEGRNVRGIIVASGIAEDLRLAASIVPDLKLFEYEMSFRLRPVTRAAGKSK